MGFLDYDGLLHFWQSIKTKFATKAEVDERLNGKADFFTRSDMDANLADLGIATPLDYANAKTLMANAGMFYPDGRICANVLAMAEVISALCQQIDANATTSAIATPDGPVATANHAVGTYLTMGGKLYRVTGAIAVGESIVAGTNVKETTVMDDTRMVVLEYGVSTWDDFLAAYEANRVVYCRVRHTSGFRMAFLAFVDKTVSRPGAEFQYYRSRDAHTDGSQGDEVYIYHLSPNGTWTTTVRNAYTRIVAGDGLKSTYANGVLTISLDQ